MLSCCRRENSLLAVPIFRSRAVVSRNLIRSHLRPIGLHLLSPLSAPRMTRIIIAIGDFYFYECLAFNVNFVATTLATQLSHLRFRNSVHGRGDSAKRLVTASHVEKGEGDRSQKRFRSFFSSPFFLSPSLALSSRMIVLFARLHFRRTLRASNSFCRNGRVLWRRFVPPR